MEKLQNSLSKLLQGAGVLFLSKVLGRALALVGHVVLIRALVPELFGQLSFAFVVVATGGMLAKVGLPKGVAREVAANREDWVQTVRSGYQVVAFVAVTACVAVYLLRRPIAVLFDSPEVAGFLAVLAVYLLLMPLSSLTVGALRGLELSTETALARDILPRVVALAALGIALATNRAVAGALLYWTVAPAMTFGIGLLMLRRHVEISKLFTPSVNATRLRRLVEFSWPLALETGFVILMTKVDVIAIGYYLDSAQVGYYRSIQPIAQSVLLILGSFVFLYLPIATGYYENDDTDSLSTLYQISTKWIVLATLPLVLVLVRFPAAVVGTLLSRSYLPASTALSVLTLGIFVRVLVGPNAANVKAVDRTRVDLVSSAVGLAVNLGLNVVLVPLYGIVGAAAATAGGFLAYNILEVGVLLRHPGIHPFSWSAAKPLVATTAAVLVGARVLSITPNSLLDLVAVGLGVTIVHVCSVLLAGGIQQEDEILIEVVESRTGADLSALIRFVRD